jgi:hypothetical protein
LAGIEGLNDLLPQLAIAQRGTQRFGDQFGRELELRYRLPESLK